MSKRKILRIILLLVFFISTSVLALRLRDNAGGSESYHNALSLATSGNQTETAPSQPEDAVKNQWVPEAITGDANMEELKKLDLDALQAVNPQVIGWIRIPDSPIDYPILQGQDNDYYLNHTWDGKQNAVGSIFLEHRNNPDLTDFNTILYGHNMNDGSMFAAIRRYNTQWYWERHPYVYLVTEQGVFRYEVFSAYESSTEGTAYGLSFHQSETKATFLSTAIRLSAADQGIRPELTDRVLTLSTCSGLGYSSRWVVHARLKMVQISE